MKSKLLKISRTARLAAALFLATGASLASAQAPAAPASAAAVTLNEQQAAAADAAGKLAATAWLNQLDAAMWGEAWDQASQVFKTNVPIGTWMDNMPKERGPLGRATDRQVSDSIVNTQMANQPAGVYVSVLFTTTFPGKPPMEEIVTTRREPDGRFRVMGYSRR
ncbi:MAG: DUF4019 domain-containing protein [Pseudomonadota bacterium]